MDKTCITATIVLPHTGGGQQLQHFYTRNTVCLRLVAGRRLSSSVCHLSSRTPTTRMKEVPGNGDGQTGAHDTLGAVDTSPATDWLQEIIDLTFNLCVARKGEESREGCGTDCGHHQRGENILLACLSSTWLTARTCSSVSTDFNEQGIGRWVCLK